MDVSRLLEVLDDIEAEFEDGLIRLIAGLVQQYTTARDSPTIDNAPLIQKAFSSLTEHIDEGRFSQYPPSKAGILNAIGGKTRVGLGLRNRLDDLMSIPGQTTAGIVTALTAVQTDVNTFKKSCTQTRVGLQGLGLSPHTIPTNQFEVGVLIPETLVDRKLSSLVKELGLWNIKLSEDFKKLPGKKNGR